MYIINLQHQQVSLRGTWNTKAATNTSRMTFMCLLPIEAGVFLHKIQDYPALCISHIKNKLKPNKNKSPIEKKKKKFPHKLFCEHPDVLSDPQVNIQSWDWSVGLQEAICGFFWTTPRHNFNAGLKSCWPCKKEKKGCYWAVSSIKKPHYISY